MAADDTADVRVRVRIKEFVDRQGHGSARKLADAVPAKFGEPRSSSWISDIVHGRADVRLKDLDAIADHLGVPPGELVRKNDRNYMELRMAEARLVGYVRTLPDRVFVAMMLVWDYLFTRTGTGGFRGQAEQGWIHPEDEAAFRRRRNLPQLPAKKG